MHVLSHGSDGVLQLGRTQLDAATLLQRAGEVAGWGASLSADADLLLYGCDLAAGDSGRQLVRDLAALSGADVAASTDLTGAAARGGDWLLEFERGPIEAALAPSADFRAHWQGLMATYTVTTTNDGLGIGLIPGSLRWAISQANANAGTDNIVFAVNGTFNLVALSSGDDNNSGGDFDINGSVNIIGNGAANTIIRGGGADRVFDLRSGTVTMSGLTVEAGKSNTGAGLRISSSVTATLDNVVVQNNIGSGSSKGGGIYNDGTLTITNSVIRNNGNSSHQTDGAGIYNDNGAWLSLRDVEIRDNVASAKEGGGLRAESGTVWMTRVTLAGNSAKAGGGAWLKDGSYTLEQRHRQRQHGRYRAVACTSRTRPRSTTSPWPTTVPTRATAAASTTRTTRSTPRTRCSRPTPAATPTPRSSRWATTSATTTPRASRPPATARTPPPGCSALADNGGGTRTHAIGAASAATDRANPVTSLTADQRGIAYYGGRADIGAYEYNPYGFVPTISAVANRTIDEDTALNGVAFVIGDVETDPNSLVVTATSSNTALVPNANLVLGGTAGNRFVSLSPAANANSSANGGATTITLTVSDGGNSVSTSFTVTVLAQNDAPVLTLPGAQAVDEDGVLVLSGAAAPQVSDVDAGAAALQFTLSSQQRRAQPGPDHRAVVRHRQRQQQRRDGVQRQPGGHQCGAERPELPPGCRLQRIGPDRPRRSATWATAAAAAPSRPAAASRSALPRATMRRA